MARTLCHSEASKAPVLLRVTPVISGARVGNLVISPPGERWIQSWRGRVNRGWVGYGKMHQANWDHFSLRGVAVFVFQEVGALGRAKGVEEFQADR